MAEDYVVLKHPEEFKKLLADYTLSDTSKRTLKKVELVLLIAPTASGRNTIIRELLKTGAYYFIVSDTTRPPKFRDGAIEQDGVNYFFRKEEEVLADIKGGKFLEAELIHNQQVSGISMRELEEALAGEKIAITDVDVGGAMNAMSLKPDTICIMVLPPSFEEWQRRIKFREDMPEAEHRRRLATALKILETSLQRDDLHFVINDTVDEAAAAVHTIARFGDRDPERQAGGRNLAEKLIIETRSFLENSK